MRADAGFRRLGFVLKPGSEHADGIVDQRAEFPDGTETERIAVTEPRDALAREYAKWIARGGGPPSRVVAGPAAAMGIWMELRSREWPGSSSGPTPTT